LSMPVYVLITLRLKRVKDAFDGLYQPEGGFDMEAPPSQF
jgi:hypothetical protein